MTMLPNCSAAVAHLPQSSLPSPTLISYPDGVEKQTKRKTGKEELHVYSEGTWQTMSYENATGSWTFEFQVRYATTGQINDNKLVKLFAEKE